MQSAGTDLENIWRYAERINGFGKRMAPCKPARPDLGKKWRYAAFTDSLIKNRVSDTLLQHPSNSNLQGNSWQAKP